MKKFKKVITIILCFVLLLVFLNGLYNNLLLADACLDGGGCWDSLDKKCRKHEADAQELCDRSPRYLVFIKFW